MTSSWTQDPGAINRWLRYELRTLRARSRQLARGDAYGAKFVRACVNNIAGPVPFRLQSKVKFTETGQFNAPANEKIERAYRAWGKAGVCEVTGKLSLAEVHRLNIRNLARDGEILLRKLRGPGYGAGQVQLLDIDRLDEQRNDNLANGGAIKMGVEVDRNSKPVAYWLLKQHPGEMGDWNRGPLRDHERVPAEEICHLFVPDWPEQVRGFPWMHAAMVRLWHLGEFELAAVVNARVGATKLATLETPDGEPPEGLITGKDSAGNLLTDTEAGQYWTLPAGTKLGKFDPQFPDASVEPFIAACLRGASAGVGMSYHSFANDPGAVNYSTARVALLEERDMWMALQSWYIEHLVEPLYADWLRQMVLSGEFPTLYGTYADTARFQPKTWDWIDPLKETQADVARVTAKLTSRTRVAISRGEDWEEILDELAEEEALAKARGVGLEPEPAPSQPSKPTPPPDDDEEDESDDEAADRGADAPVTVRDIMHALANPPAPTVKLGDTHVQVTPAPQPITIRNEPAQVSVNAPVTVEAAQIHVPAPAVKVEAPITVEAAQVHLPETVVKIDAPVTVAPAEVKVTLEQEDGDREQLVEQDEDGNIKRVVTRTLRKPS